MDDVPIRSVVSVGNRARRYIREKGRRARGRAGRRRGPSSIAWLESRRIHHY